jgi:2-methylcitrate dehydratase PrpD
LVHDLAEMAANADYAKLPAVAADAAKKSILDTLGVILAAGGMEPAVRGVIDLVRETGGRPESSVLGFAARAPALMAAFANGAMAHCLDFDDHTPFGQHAASSLVPAGFSVAERRGGVSGRDMIAAVAAGQDIFVRLRCNVGWRKDWNLSTVMGVFAATATACRVMGFSCDRIAHALGIASMQSCGTMEVIAGIGSDLRGMYAGFSAKGAVLAALLAEKGLTGVQTLFEGRDGIFNTYFDGKYDRAKILENLGTEYTGAAMLYKPWPAVGTAHSHIHATMELVRQHDLAPHHIAEIRVFVGDYHELMCQPLEARRAPATLVDARFSLPFLVAVAAVRRDMKISDFSRGGLQDPEVLAVAQKVVPIRDRGLDWKLDLPGGRVEIVTYDNRTFEQSGQNVPGTAAAPMTWDDIAAKFRACAAAAATPPSLAQIEAVQQMARNLETLDDATELLRAIE